MPSLQRANLELEHQTSFEAGGQTFHNSYNTGTRAQYLQHWLRTSLVQKGGPHTKIYTSSTRVSYCTGIPRKKWECYQRITGQLAKSKDIPVKGLHSTRETGYVAVFCRKAGSLTSCQPGSSPGPHSREFQYGVPAY